MHSPDDPSVRPSQSRRIDRSNAHCLVANSASLAGGMSKMTAMRGCILGMCRRPLHVSSPNGWL